MAYDEESLFHDYIDGRNARRNGQSLNDCPYLKLSPNGLRWTEGWKDRDTEVAAESGKWEAMVRVAAGDLLGEIHRVRSEIGAARAAGFDLGHIEKLHDKLLALYRFE